MDTVMIWMVADLYKIRSSVDIRQVKQLLVFDRLKSGSKK